MSLDLEHSPADVARTVLVNAGAGTAPSANAAWPIYTAGEPPTPDEVITIYDTAPRPDCRIMKDGEQKYHYGIQVRVRALDHKPGFKKAHSFKKIMDESIKNVTIVIEGITYFLQCFTNTAITFMGKETPTSKRTILTINGYAVVKRID